VCVCSSLFYTAETRLLPGIITTAQQYRIVHTTHAHSSIYNVTHTLFCCCCFLFSFYISLILRFCSLLSIRWGMARYVRELKGRWHLNHLASLFNTFLLLKRRQDDDYYADGCTGCCYMTKYAIAYRIVMNDKYMKTHERQKVKHHSTSSKSWCIISILLYIRCH
jgi:hypothetical protein